MKLRKIGETKEQKPFDSEEIFIVSQTCGEM
jgi:hypothetical protein